MANKLNVANTEHNDSLSSKREHERIITPLNYIFIWMADGVNLGNMTLGASLFIAGVATINLIQTIAAATIAIFITSIIFILNDQTGYRTGVPYVIQLRMSFGVKGSVISSLMRGIPAVIWYGFQSWIGATALNEILKVFTNGEFNHIFVCFIILQGLQIILSLYGFHAIKWVETLISIVIISALLYVFIILMTQHSDKIVDNWVNAEGTWGISFWGFVMVFMGNYAAIFLSAADYSRELKSGISNVKRGFLYFIPILISYGFVLIIGAMLAAATGIVNPVEAFPLVVKNEYITVIVSSFIILGVIGVNMVANIVAPAYVISALTKIKYKPAAIITGLLAIASFPWLLVQDDNAVGLQLFIRIYSAFLGPIIAILLVDYYLIRKQVIDINELYNENGPLSGVNKIAVISMLIGAMAAFVEVNLTWIIGFFVGGLAYFILSKRLCSSLSFSFSNKVYTRDR